MLELEFLREVDARGDLYTKEVVHRAVYRCRKFKNTKCKTQNAKM